MKIEVRERKKIRKINFSNENFCLLLFIEVVVRNSLLFQTNFDHRASEKQTQCNVRKKQCSKSTFVLSISSLKNNCFNDTATVAKLLIFFSSILTVCSFLLPINVKVDTFDRNI